MPEETIYCLHCDKNVFAMAQRSYDFVRWLCPLCGRILDYEVTDDQDDVEEESDA